VGGKRKHMLSEHRPSASDSAGSTALTLLPVRQVWFVLGAALLIRIAYWFLYSRTPFFNAPVVDASFFDIWAQSIVAGRDFQPDVFFKPPLYPYGLALVFKTLGHHLTPVFVLQTLCGIAGSLLVLMLGRLVFTPRIALIGALAAALMPMSPFFELQLLAESLTTFLSLLALLLVLLATRRPGSPTLWQVGVAGVILGVAALGRPNLLLLPPLVAVWLLFRTRSQDPSITGRSRLRPAVVLLAGAILAVSPVTLRNLRVGGAMVPVCANFGVNLWTGHHAGADGTSPIPVGVQWDDLQLRCRQAGAGSAVASSRFLTREAVQYMLSHPGRTATITVKKAAVMVTALEIRNNIGAAFLAREYGIFLLGRWWPGFWLLGPFAILGLWGARRWGGPGQLLWLYVAALFLSVLPFFANARFRLPLLPVLALWAAVGWDHLATVVGEWRAGRDSAGRLWRGLALLAVAFLVVNIDWYGLDRPVRFARDHFYLGTILDKGYNGKATDPTAASNQFRRAQQLNGSDPDFPERHGQHLLTLAGPFTRRAEVLRDRRQWRAAFAYSDSAAGYLTAAAALHRRAAELFPRSFRSHANAGSCQLWLGDGHASRAQEALARSDTSRARDEALEALERYAEAGRAYQEALVIWSAFPEAAANLSLCVERILALPPLTGTISTYQDRLRQ
jgi:4-amino-4-deoxy-L-arabinose transferase-like glycosyltransferase